MTTLRDVLDYGDKNNASLEQKAQAVELYRTEQESQVTDPRIDPEERQKFLIKLDSQVDHAYEELRIEATGEELKRQFPDEVERQTFLTRWAHGRMEQGPEFKMPSEFDDKIAAVDRAAQPFQRPSRVYGSLEFNGSYLGSYIGRPVDGKNYEFFVKGKEGKPVVTSVEIDRQKIVAREKNLTDLYQKELDSTEKRFQEDPFSFGRGAESDPTSNYIQLKRYNQENLDTAKTRLNLAENGSQGQIAHMELMDSLKGNDQFKDQIPNNWASQFVGRPLTGVFKGFAQAGAAIPNMFGSDYAKEVLTEGDAAMETVVPGALRNRFEAKGTPVADMASQGVESLITFFTPGAVAKLGGKALTYGGKAAQILAAGSAIRGVTEAGIISKAGYTAFGTTAFGNSFAQRIRAAENEPDPVKAEQIRTWAPWLAIGDAITEVISEKILPYDERLLLRGGKGGFLRRLGTAVAMPLNESAEEAIGSIIRSNFLGAGIAPGSPKEDILENIKGGFFGGLAFTPRAFFGTNVQEEATPDGKKVWHFNGTTYDNKALAEEAKANALAKIDESLKPAGIETQEDAVAFLERHDENLRLREEDPTLPPVTDSELDMAALVTDLGPLLPKRSAPSAGDQTAEAGADAVGVATPVGGIAPDSSVIQNSPAIPVVNNETSGDQTGTATPAVNPSPAPPAAPVAAPQVSLTRVEAPPAAAARAADIEQFAPGIQYFNLDNSTPEGRVVEQLAKATGTKVVLFEAGKGQNGKVTDGFVIPGDPKTIYIARNSVQPFLHVLGHEFFHNREDMPEYQAFAEELKRLEPDAWTTAQTKFSDPAKALSEFVADVVGTRFNTREFWDRLQKEMPSSLFQKFVDYVRQIWDRLKTQMGPRAVDIKNVGAIDKMLADLLPLQPQAGGKLGTPVQGVQQSETQKLVRFVHKDGKGMLDRSAWNLSKLTEDEELELPELLDFGLEQPRNVPTNSKFYFTEEGEQQHSELIRLIGKASKSGGLVREEVESSQKPVWESGDGQVAISPIKQSEVTPEKEQRYMAAVERGDMRVAQRMVDEAAKAAGYDLSHRRRKNNPRDAGFVLQFTDDRESNTSYGPHEFLLRSEDVPSVPNWAVIWYSKTDQFQEFAELNNIPEDEWVEQAEAAMNPTDIVDSANFWDGADLVSAFWNENEDRLLRERLFGFKTPDGAVVFDPQSAAIKSAEAVTYDDNGKVVPLGERFNPNRTDIRFSQVPAVETQRLGVEDAVNLHEPKLVDDMVGTTVEFVRDLNTDQLNALIKREGQTKQERNAADALVKKLQGRVNRLPGANFEIEEVRLVLAQVAINHWAETVQISPFERAELMQRYNDQTKLATKAGQILRLQKAVTEFLGRGGALFGEVNREVKSFVNRDTGAGVSTVISDAALPTPESIAEDRKQTENTVHAFNQEKPDKVAKAVTDTLAAIRKLQALRAGIKQTEIGDDELARLAADLESGDTARVEAAMRRFAELTEDTSAVPEAARVDVARSRRSITEARVKSAPEADALEYASWLAAPQGESPQTPVASVIRTFVENQAGAGEFNAKTSFDGFMRTMKENLVSPDVGRQVWPTVRQGIERQRKSAREANTNAVADSTVAEGQNKAAAKTGKSPRLKPGEKSVVEDLVSDLKAAETLPDRDTFIAQFTARFPDAPDKTRLKLQAAGIYDNVAEAKKRMAERLNERAEAFLRRIGGTQKAEPSTQLTWIKAYNDFVRGEQKETSNLEATLVALNMPAEHAAVVAAIADTAREMRDQENDERTAEKVAEQVRRLKAREDAATKQLNTSIDAFVAKSPVDATFVKAGANDFRALHRLFVSGGGFDVGAYRAALTARGISPEQADKLIAFSQEELEARIEEELATDLTKQAREKNRRVAAALAFEEEVTRFVTGNTRAAVRVGSFSYKDLHRRFVAGEFKNVDTYRQILVDHGVPAALADTLIAHAQAARGARVAREAVDKANKERDHAEGRLDHEIESSRNVLTPGPVRAKNPASALKAYLNEIRAGKQPLPNRNKFINDLNTLMGVDVSLKAGELWLAMTNELAYRGLEDLRDSILAEHRKEHKTVMTQADLKAELIKRATAAGIPTKDVDTVASRRSLSSVKGNLGKETFELMLRNSADVSDPVARARFYKDRLIEACFTDAEATALLLKKDSKGRTLEDALEAEIARRRSALIKRVENASPEARERLRQNNGRVRDTMMAYLLSGDSALLAFAKATGFKMRLTAAEIARFEFLNRKLAEATTETERALHTREIAYLIAKVGPSEDWKQILNSLYLASIYSAPTTMAVNVMAPGVQAMMTAATEFLRLATYDARKGGNFGSNVSLMIGTMMDSFKSALVEARFAAKTGILAQSIEKMESGFSGLTSIERQAALNSARIDALRSQPKLSVGDRAELAKLYAAQLYHLQRVTFRILGTIDSGYGKFFSTYFTAMRKHDLLRRQGLNNKQIRDLIKSRRTQAVRDALADEFRLEFGSAAGGAEMARYITERITQETDRLFLAEGVTPDELHEADESGFTEARFLLGTNDFNRKEEDLGLIGVVNRGIRVIRREVDTKVPYLGMAVFGPTTIVGNIANRLAYFTPAGFLRIAQATEIVGGKRVVKQPDADGKQRNPFQSGLRYNTQIPQRVIEAWLGTIVTGVMGVLRALQPPKDDEDKKPWFGINLSGPDSASDRQQWEREGNKPNTIWFSDGSGGRINLEISRSAELFRPAAVVIGMLDQRDATINKKDDATSHLIKTVVWHTAYTLMPATENIARFFKFSGPTSSSTVETSARNQAFTAAPIVFPFSGFLNTYNRLSTIPETEGFKETLMANIPLVGPMLMEGRADNALKVNGMGLVPTADQTWFNKLDKLKLFPLSYNKPTAEEFGVTENVLRRVGYYPQPFDAAEVQDFLRRELKDSSLEVSLKTAARMTVDRGKLINEKIKGQAAKLLSMDRDKAREKVQGIVNDASDKQRKALKRVERLKKTGQN